MTDKEVEDIIKSNMNLQMNLAGIRADFEEKLQRTWVGLTDEDKNKMAFIAGSDKYWLIRLVENKLKELNT